MKIKNTGKQQGSPSRSETAASRLPRRVGGEEGLSPPALLPSPHPSRLGGRALCLGPGACERLQLLSHIASESAAVEGSGWPPKDGSVGLAPHLPILPPAPQVRSRRKVLASGRGQEALTEGITRGWQTHPAAVSLEPLEDQARGLVS